jgi:predicted permease
MELRYAVRQLARSPRFTAIAVLTLALGIAGVSVFYAAVNALVFEPARAGNLEGLYHVTFIQRNPGIHGPLTAQRFRRLEADAPPSIARLGAMIFYPRPVVAAVGRRAEQLAAEIVSSGFPAALELTPQAGRFFLREDDVAGAAPAVVISDRLWREWFDNDRTAIGRAIIRLNGAPFTVVGVAPRGYQGIRGMGTDLWITITAAPQVAANDQELRRVALDGYYTTFVRPAAGASPVEIETAVRALLTSRPGDPDPAVTTVRLSPATSFFQQRGMTAAGATIVALASFLLVAACANLANMLFARGTDRAGEVAVRLSLGASRFQVFRLFLIEHAMLCALASLAGLVLTLGATSLIGSAFPSISFQLFRSLQARVFVDLAPDVRVVLFALAAGACSALAVGSLAAWRASAVPPARVLAASGIASVATKRGRALGIGMVTVQVAVAVLLLMGAGLFLRMTESALDRFVVFDTKPLATALVDLRLHGYNDAQGRVFLDRLLRDVRALPGVEQAALTDGFPGGGYAATRPVQIVTPKETANERGEMRVLPGEVRRLTAGYAAASPGLPATLGLPLIRGRDIAPSDQDSTPLVAVVSRNVAAALWPGQDPVGKRLMFGNDGHWRTVVGVSEDPITHRTESPLTSPANMVLIPAAQAYRPDTLIVVRSRAPGLLLDPLRSAARAIDENVALFDVATAAGSIMAWVAPLHAATALTALSGALALTIAVLGIYGVVAYAVSRRTKEFGIRAAVGASSAQLVRTVIDEAVTVLLLGLLAGVFVTSVGERYLQSQRFGFMPNEISTWVGVLLLILAVGLVAAYIPARRVARIDPNEALRDL